MIIKCPECGKKISDKAKFCIHCGFTLIMYCGLVGTAITASTWAMSRF